MARDITAAVISELTKPHVRPHLFFEGVFENITLRLWTGVGDITWNGHTWLGNGWLHGISNVVEEANQINSLEVVLTGLNATLLSTILNYARRCDSGKLWLGFLVDTNLENRALYSEAFESWSFENVTASDAATPNPVDRQFTASAVAVTSATGNHDIYRTFTAENGPTYRLSLWAKPRECSRLRITAQNPANAYVNFNLGTGEVEGVSGGAAGSICPAGGGWYRCTTQWVSGRSGSTWIAFYLRSDAGLTSYTGVSGDGLYLYGPHLRKVACSDTYVKTTTAAITSSGPGMAVIADPIEFFSGYLDQPKAQVQPESSTLIVAYRSKQVVGKSGSGHLYTHESQRATYPEDKGFQYSSLAKSWRGRWGAQT